MFKTFIILIILIIPITDSLRIYNSELSFITNNIYNIIYF